MLSVQQCYQSKSAVEHAKRSGFNLLRNGHLFAFFIWQEEDKDMTRTHLQINQEDMWRTLVFEQQTTLTLAVEMLSRRHLSPEQIITKTAMALEGLHYDS
jgi:hypothetical protein